MIGNLWFRWVNGTFYDHIGWLGTANVALGPVLKSDPNGVVQRGTFVDEDPNNRLTQCILGSGSMIGMLTQDLDSQGLTGLQGFKDFSIGKFDRRVQQGIPVSIRQPEVGSQAEFESGGVLTDGITPAGYVNAQPGNLVCVSGTGAVNGSNAPYNGELTCFNGSIRAAQTGDLVFALLRDASYLGNTCPPLASPSNVRIRVEFIGRYMKISGSPAPNPAG